MAFTLKSEQACRAQIPAWICFFAPKSKAICGKKEKKYIIQIVFFLSLIPSPLIIVFSSQSNNFSKEEVVFIIPEIDGTELCLLMVSCWLRDKQLGWDIFIHILIIISERRLTVLISLAPNKPNPLHIRALHLSTFGNRNHLTELVFNSHFTVRVIHQYYLTRAVSASSNRLLQLFSSELDLAVSPLTGPWLCFGVVKVHLTAICQWNDSKRVQYL